MKTNTKKDGHRWRLMPRAHGVLYAHDRITKERKSLKTRNEAEAQEKVDAMNRAAAGREFNESMAMIYLQNAQRVGLDKTWSDVMRDNLNRADLAPPTIERMTRAYAGKDFDSIRDKVLLKTTAEDFRRLIELDKSSVTNYLKGLQSRAVDLQWLTNPVLAGKVFKTRKKKEARPITETEHLRILADEMNSERRNYYRMLWAIGAAQTDCANLKAENFNHETKELIYIRKKTEETCRLAIGAKLAALLDELPASGYLFPNIRKMNQKDRSSEFGRRCRCKSVGVKGVTLHSYRYAWAVRAAEAGVPIRYAQAALGHRSQTVARAYAKSAVPLCPSFD